MEELITNEYIQSGGIPATFLQFFCFNHFVAVIIL